MYLQDPIPLKDSNGQSAVVRVGDELVQRGIPAHKMTYVGPVGPTGEDVVDAPKAQVARFVRLAEIPAWHELVVGKRGPDVWDVAGQRAVQTRAHRVVSAAVLNRPAGPNCEHIGSYVRDGNPESPQLRAVAGLALALVVWGMLG